MSLKQEYSSHVLQKNWWGNRKHRSSNKLSRNQHSVKWVIIYFSMGRPNQIIRCTTIIIITSLILVNVLIFTWKRCVSCTTFNGLYADAFIRGCVTHNSLPFCLSSAIWFHYKSNMVNISNKKISLKVCLKFVSLF